MGAVGLAVDLRAVRVPEALRGGCDPRPINMIAATKPTERNKPSCSTYAREISEITIAGTTLLKGIGVSKIMKPTSPFATSKVLRQRG